MTGLSQGLELSVRQALEIVGGATNSIFPEVEALLLASSDHQKALEFVASRKKMGRYRSMIDFIFCEIFTHYQPACFRYYKDKGPLLKEMITDEQLLFFNNALLKALEIAYKRFKEQRIASWTDYRFEVQQCLEKSA